MTSSRRRRRRRSCCRRLAGSWSSGDALWSYAVILAHVNRHVALPPAVVLVVVAWTLRTLTVKAARNVDALLAGQAWLQPDRTLIDVYM